MKRCRYCDMELPYSKVICPNCGRPQKIAFTVILPLIILFVAAGIFALDKFLPEEKLASSVSSEQTAMQSSAETVDDDAKNKYDDKKTVNSNELKSENSQKTTFSQSLSGVEVKSGKDVVIIIHADWLNMLPNDETIKTELTDDTITSAKSQGFKNVELLDDGSLKYTISKSNYKKFIADYRKRTVEALKNLCDSEQLTSVKNITYNDDFSKVTITVDKEKYKNSYDFVMTTSVALTCRMYQYFDIDSKQKVVVNILDATTGDVFETKTYPES